VTAMCHSMVRESPANSLLSVVRIIHDSCNLPFTSTLFLPDLERVELPEVHHELGPGVQTVMSRDVGYGPLKPDTLERYRVLIAISRQDRRDHSHDIATPRPDTRVHWGRQQDEASYQRAKWMHRGPQ
jgi:hypothetical protein